MGGVVATPAGAQAPFQGPLTVLDVPFISQTEALCGGAAAAMVLRYWGARGLTAESFAHLVDESAAGIRTDALIGELRQRGWSATGIVGNDDTLRTELMAGRPVLTLVEDRPGTYHYIVIVAMTEETIIFHDPARAPFRVLGRAAFQRRWGAANRWMAVVVPAAQSPSPAATVSAAPALSPTARGSECEQMIAEGVQFAQRNALDAAERTLVAALSCSGSAPLRELAGVRVLQRRWPDASELAAAAVAIDAADAHAWRILATSRYVQDEPMAALEAWNAVDEPRVDLLRSDGLNRTRQRAVEVLMGVRTGEVLTPSTFTRARRRLMALPAASTSSLQYIPVGGGLAELRAAVVERPLFPRSATDLSTMAIATAVRREVEVAFGAPTGAGEAVRLDWRFWRDRPRVGLALDAPAPWGGVWGLAADWEQQPFDRSDLPTPRRTSVHLSASEWLTSTMRLSGRAGIDRWDATGSFGRIGADVSVASRADRLVARMSADVWASGAPFATASIAIDGQSSRARLGPAVELSTGLQFASRRTPHDIWFAGDTGHARSTLLRAHPLIENGRYRSAQMGRILAHASAEAQYWWRLPLLLRLGGAMFLDTARTDRRLDAGARHDADAGVGLRIALPGASGTMRVDVAKGLRDGATALSVVYRVM